MWCSSLFCSVAAGLLLVSSSWAGDRDSDNSEANRDRTNQQKTMQSSDSSDRNSSAAKQKQQMNSGKQQAAQCLEDFDDNDDGSLQRNELPRQMRDKFDKLDANGDGKLSREELQKHMQQASKRTVPVEFIYIWVTDTSQGNLSIDELQQAYSLLQKIDEDGNGEITSSEVRARQKEIVTEKIRALTKKLDQNDDGKLSRKETRDTIQTAQFEQMDEDGDGYLTESELRASVNSSSNKNQSADRRNRDDKQSAQK